jgi:hypothetical protein
MAKLGKLVGSHRLLLSLSKDLKKRVDKIISVREAGLNILRNVKKPLFVRTQFNEIEFKRGTGHLILFFSCSIIFRGAHCHKYKVTLPSADEYTVQIMMI